MIWRDPRARMAAVGSRDWPRKVESWIRRDPEQTRKRNPKKEIKKSCELNESGLNESGLNESGLNESGLKWMKGMKVNEIK